MIGLLLLLVVGQVDGQLTSYPRVREVGARQRGRENVTFAQFEAFPANGRGTAGVCSTTSPTGARGETLTFTRASSAICTKTATGGLATTGIANGDLVSLTNNQPRVEYDSQGVLGLLVESARTNSLLRSEQLDNAAWTKLGAGGPAAPTVTADFAVAPDGTTTADRVQVNACAGAATASVVFQDYTGTAATWAGAPYIKGNGTSGSISVYYYDATAGAGTAIQCSFVAATWTRCVGLTRAFANVTHRFGMGCINDAVITGSTNTGAVDVLVWSSQSEAGAYTTSYIPTVAAAATRSAEQAEFTLSSHTLSAPFSFAATTSLPAGLPTNARLHGAVGPSGLATYIDSFLSAGTWVADSTQVTPNNLITAQTTTASSTVRAATYHDGTNFAGCLNSACSTAARALSDLASVTVLRVGEYSSASGTVDGVQSRLCYQPGDPSRCR